MPQGPGDIHVGHDPYFLAILEKYRYIKGDAPVYWDAFRHEWIYRKVHEEQEKQKVQFKRHQDQVEAKKKKDAFDAKNEQAQARVEAAQKAKAWRDAKKKHELHARQTADKLALAQKAKLLLDRTNDKKEKEQARVDAERKAKAWREAKALQDILARQTADKLALAQKAADKLALAQKAVTIVQQDQGQPPVAVHIGLLPPGPKKASMERRRVGQAEHRDR